MMHITVNGNQVEWSEGLSVKQLLKNLNYTFPMLVIKINGTLVKKLDYESTTIPPDAIVTVMHLISGG